MRKTPTTITNLGDPTVWVTDERLRELLNDEDSEAVFDRTQDRWERAEYAYSAANPNRLNGMAEWQHQMRAALRVLFSE